MGTLERVTMYSLDFTKQLEFRLDSVSAVLVTVDTFPVTVTKELQEQIKERVSLAGSSRLHRCPPWKEVRSLVCLATPDLQRASRACQRLCPAPSHSKSVGISLDDFSDIPRGLCLR